MTRIPKPDEHGVRHYGSSSPSNPKGQPKDPERCIAEVSDLERWSRFYQCSRPRGHGPTGQFCRQHAPVREEDKEQWWVVPHNENRPVSVLVDRYSPKCVWINGSREQRRSKWSTYYPTKEGAFSAYLTSQEIKITRAKDSIQRARQEMAWVKKQMKEDR